MVATTQSHYIHALRYQWLNRFYDPVVALTTRDAKMKQALIACLPATPGSVLDVAAGTGTLSRAIKRAFPATPVVGVDGDPDMVQRARQSASKEGLDASYSLGFAQAMPYEDGAFDTLVSSLFFHHLEAADKLTALKECYRVTKHGGELVIADWGKPQNLMMRAVFLIVQCLDGFATTRENVEGRLPALVEEAGFRDVRVARQIGTPLGTIAVITASKVEKI